MHKSEIRKLEIGKGKLGKRIAVTVAAFVFVAAGLAAQESAPGTKATNDSASSAQAQKTTKVSGRISDDGKTCVEDRSNAVWKIANPDAVEDAAGMHVIVRAHLSGGSHEMEVVFVRIDGAAGARLQDAAFRR